MQRGFLFPLRKGENIMHTLQQLEKKLGYTFRCREQLQAALYHSSYANEHRCCGISSNERLEFLGDADRKSVV